MNALFRFFMCLPFIMLGSCIRPGGFEIGGGGTTHVSPNTIPSDQFTTIDLEVSTWGEGTGKILSRWTNVKCHYRLVGETNYVAIPMEVKSEEPNKAVLTCKIPPQNRSNVTMEYYFDAVFDGQYSKREGGRVLVVSGADTSVVSPRGSTENSSVGSPPTQNSQ